MVQVYNTVYVDSNVSYIVQVYNIDIKSLSLIIKYCDAIYNVAALSWCNRAEYC